MDYFIIGDIHGCFFTFSELLKQWKADEEYLISVGDLIDRGNYSAKVIEECMRISSENDNAVFLKGNHEAEMIEHFTLGGNENWIKQGGDQTLADFAANKSDLETIISWMRQMPLKFETDPIIVSHAGISNTSSPFEENNNDGVLWNRKELKNLGKVQIHGHTPLKDPKPAYDFDLESWNIDTGAVYGYGLTAIRLAPNGRLIKVIHIPTDPRDVTIERESIPAATAKMDYWKLLKNQFKRVKMA